MKKLFSLITILSFLMQVIPLQTNAALSGDFYNSGDIVIISDEDGKFYTIDAGASPTPFTMNSGVASGITTPKAQAFLPNGDLVMVNVDFNVNAINANTMVCFTAQSNYTQTCSWSGYAIEASTPIDPSTGLASANLFPNPTVNVLTDEPVFYMSVSANGDIWTTHNGLGMAGGGVDRYLVRTSPPYTTSVAYDLKFDGDLSIGPFYTTIDYMGDVWVTIFDFTSPGHNKVYCLDASNSFNSCSGPAFDANGGITVGNGPVNILTDTNNDIYVATAHEGAGSDGKINKIDRDQNFTVTEIASSFPVLPYYLEQPYFMTMDPDNNIWVHTKDPNNEIRCFTSSLAVCSGISSINFPNAGTYDHLGVFFSKKGTDDYLWALVVNNQATSTDDRLYCFNTDNPTPPHACTGSFSTDTGYTYKAFNNLSGLAESSVDNSGFVIRNLFIGMGGEAEAQITATVDPVISVTFRTSADDGPLVDNLCTLGNISDGTVKTCGYRIAIDTNATNGFSISADANGGLISGSDEIDAIAENSTVSANTEGYGIAVVKPADTAGTTFTEVGDFSDDDTPVPNAITQIVTSDGPIDWTAATLNTSTLITHRVAVSPVTPAGSYSQVITYTITGNF